jgi:hypothetical protein
MTDQTLERFHRALIEEIQTQRPEYLTQPFTVAEIYQNLVPYGSHRDRIGVEMNGDYEDALVRLLAGEGGYLILDSEPALENLRAELDAPTPNSGVYREYAAVDVRLNQAYLDLSAEAMDELPDLYQELEAEDPVMMTELAPAEGNATAAGDTGVAPSGVDIFDGSSGGRTSSAGPGEREEIGEAASADSGDWTAPAGGPDLDLTVTDPAADGAAAEEARPEARPHLPDELAVADDGPAADDGEAAADASFPAEGGPESGVPVADDAEATPADEGLSAVVDVPADPSAVDRIYPAVDVHEGDAGEHRRPPLAPEFVEPEKKTGAEDSAGPMGRRGAVPGGTCLWCRADLPERNNLNYCPFCGTDVDVVPCPQCGDEVQPRWLFCASCGAEVDT